MDCTIIILCLLQLCTVAFLLIILVRLGVIEDTINDSADDMKTEILQRLRGFLDVLRRSSKHLENKEKL